MIVSIIVVESAERKLSVDSFHIFGLKLVAQLLNLQFLLRLYSRISIGLSILCSFGNSNKLKKLRVGKANAYRQFKPITSQALNR